MKIVELNITADQAKEKYGPMLGYDDHFGSTPCAVLEIEGVNKLVSMEYIQDLDLIFY